MPELPAIIDSTVKRLAAVAGSEPPLGGRWRHSNGVLCCGTLRIAVDSFDTDPAPEFQAEIWEWVCDTLNKAQNAPTLPPA